MLLHTLDIAASTLASTLCYWRGTSASKTTQQPEKELILFDREGSPDCRYVREALTELNLNATITPCPVGGKNLQRLQQEYGVHEVPFLVDPNSDTHLSNPQEIIDHLFNKYRGISAPEKFRRKPLSYVASRAATLIRFNAGVNARPSGDAKKPLTLYSFESSPYSRPVRELLCELELTYHLVNLGKQQWIDMGPAKPRLTIKPYKPLPNTKRDTFFQAHGNVQVPYLVDPNTDQELFESKDILSYLRDTYTTS